ncbi:MAG: hypothetical protein ACRC80_35085 [Waterburya sp.]
MIDSFNSLDQLATKRANTTTKPDIDKTYAEKPKIKVLKAVRGKGKIKSFNLFPTQPINTDAYPNSITQ